MEEIREKIKDYVGNLLMRTEYIKEKKRFLKRRMREYKAYLMNCLNTKRIEF